MEAKLPPQLNSIHLQAKDGDLSYTSLSSSSDDLTAEVNSLLFEDIDEAYPSQHQTSQDQSRAVVNEPLQLKQAPFLHSKKPSIELTQPQQDYKVQEKTQPFSHNRRQTLSAISTNFNLIPKAQSKLYKDKKGQQNKKSKKENKSFHVINIINEEDNAKTEKFTSDTKKPPKEVCNIKPEQLKYSDNKQIQSSLKQQSSLDVSLDRTLQSVDSLMRSIKQNNTTSSKNLQNPQILKFSQTQKGSLSGVLLSHPQQSSSNYYRSDNFNKTAYSILLQKKLQKGSTSNLQNSLHQRKITNYSNGIDVFDKLYQEKHEYFQRKSSQRDTNLEKQLKDCTFTPNSTKQLVNHRNGNHRSFKELYQDFQRAQQKSKERLNELSQTINPSFSQTLKSINSGREIAEKLYKDGVNKIKEKVQYESQTVDTRFKYKPEVNKNSEMILQQNKQTSSMKEKIEKLTQEQMKKPKNHEMNIIETSREREQHSGGDLKCLEKRIDKQLHEAMYQLDFSSENCLSKKHLFKVLQYLNYASLRDESFITTEVFPMFMNSKSLISWTQFKFLLCCIENLYLADFCSGRTVNYLSKLQLVIRSKDDLIKVHKKLIPLLIEKQNASYRQRQLQMKEMRKQLDQLEGITHNPIINRRSVQIDQENTIAYETGHGVSSSGAILVPRNEMLIQKGKEYKEQKQKRALDRQSQELVGCTFKPQIYSESFSKRSSVHEALYEKGQKATKSRRTQSIKSKDDIEFEKNSKDLTFNPNLTLTKNYTNKFNETAKITKHSHSQSHSVIPQQVISNFETTQEVQVQKESSFAQHYSQFTELQQQVTRLSEVIQQAKLREEDILMKNLLISHKQPSTNQTPVLYLEVNIGNGGTGKLMMFDGDSTEEVVQCFANYYQLTENKRLKLLDIVKQQLTKILQQIGEEADDKEESSPIHLLVATKQQPKSKPPTVRTKNTTLKSSFSTKTARTLR